MSLSFTSPMKKSFFATAMSAASSTPQNQKNNGNIRIPPPRGQVKAQIFESLKKALVSALTGNKGKDAGSAAGTQLASAYSSDANSEKA
ncbi:hypothetical protein CISIN_1g034658mg [Citrus sinensis]|uniref:Uncharacterized protein n=2 Tax=Citrus TaxID=2706 RepID=A0A067GC28_CITSI|nr:hypothetical protein CISIN_1g034658mg [Citrus sinensis]